MTLSKELLAKLGEKSDLARACDSAAVELKILLATWDGLEPAEEKLLGVQEAAVLTAQEVQALVGTRLAELREGAPVEDRILERLRDTMGRVPEALRPEIGRALLVDALPLVLADKVLSGQERELVLQELVPALCIEQVVAESLLEQTAEKLKGG